VNVQLLRDCIAALDLAAFKPGEINTEIEYCRHCHYSQDWIAKHGHGDACVITHLRSVLDDSTADMTTGANP
jgi:hypothetical protein